MDLLTNRLNKIIMQKIDEALLEAYRMAFELSTPRGDFDELLKNATTNSRGEKVIPFEKYQCDEQIQERILEQVAKKYKIKGVMLERFRITYMLGCSPVF